MASILPTIRKLLETKLSEVVGIPDIAWENIKYNPTTGSPYVKPTFIPTIRRPNCVGVNPEQYYQGLFQLECFVPTGRGPSEADELAQLLTTEFDATTTISDTDVSIIIRRTEVSQGITDDAWHKTIVSISWFTYN